MAKIKLNDKQLVGACISTFQETCFIAHRSMIQVISEPGAFSSSAEDIVDTGLLRASQQLPVFSADGTVAYFVNTIEYAIYVHEGYTMQNGREIEGRSWMTTAIDRTNLQGTYNKLLAKKLG